MPREQSPYANFVCTDQYNNTNILHGNQECYSITKLVSKEMIPKIQLSYLVYVRDK